MIGVVSTVSSSHTGKSANVKWIDQSLRLDGMEMFENLQAKSTKSIKLYFELSIIWMKRKTIEKRTRLIDTEAQR